MYFLPVRSCVGTTYVYPLLTVHNIGFTSKYDGFLSAFQLEHFEIKYSDNSEAPENIRNECCPGEPYITFLPSEASLSLLVVNPQPQKPFFQRELAVYDNDTVKKLIKRLKKIDLKLSECIILLLHYQWSVQKFGILGHDIR